MIIDNELLNSRLQHVYWIGGGSGAGKSTIARRLAARYSLHLYPTDDVMLDHAQRCSPKDNPFLTAFKQMDMDERWVNRCPETMLETFHWFRGEGFGLIVEDLLKLPSGKRIIVEGFRLLPKLVKPLLRRPSQGIWLIPTPEFRLGAFEIRGSLRRIAEKTSNPRLALANLLRRDQMFTERVRRDAVEVGVPLIEVDGSMSEDVLEAHVAREFTL